jgi:hypothetical protein
MNQITRRKKLPKSLPLGVRERIYIHVISLASGIIDHCEIEPEISELAGVPLSEAVKELKEFGIDPEEGWKELIRNCL